MKPILASQIGMNATERKYCEMLSLRKAAGEIVDYVWEPMQLVLTHNIKGRRNRMTYTPDFLIVTPERFELHEIKAGWKKGGKIVTGWRGDAKEKLKMASEMFPWFRFICVTLKGKKWVYEEF